jgi:putative ABC transport system permease protein
MASALARKSWTDLSRRPGRSVLTVLTLALAVASFGILALPALVNGAMASEVAQARLYDVRLPVDTVALSSAQLQALARLPNVAAVSARAMFATRALIGTRRVSTEVWGVPDFSDQPVDQVITATVPGPGQVLVDTRDAMSGISHARAGGTLAVEGADGTFQALPVAGSARAMAFNQDTLTGQLVLYASQATVQRLGGLTGVNLIELRLRDPGHAAAVATVAAVRAFLSGQPHPTAFSDVPTVRAPGDWPLKAVFTSRAKVLDILIVLAVVSAVFLLTNTVRTLITEQRREVGVMRSIGASGRDVRNSYLRTAALLGLFGSALGACIGVGLAGVLARMFARVVFGVTPALAVDWPVVAISAVAGVVGAVLTAWPVLHRMLRIPVHDALSTEGLVSAYAPNAVDRAVLGSRAVPPPVRIGVRGIARQKGRSATTIVQVALAVATLLGLLSLGLAVSRVTDQSWDVLDYDLTLSTQPGRPQYAPAVLDEVRAQPGVAGVEPADWVQASYRGQTLYALGVHAATFVREPIAAGRWLAPQDERGDGDVAVLGSAIARRWHVGVGTHLTVSAARGPITFTVVGVGASDADNGYNIYTTLGALQAATGSPGGANSLLVRASDTRHSAIDALAVRLEGLLARSGQPSRSQVMYAGRATDEATSHSMMAIVEGIGLLIVGISMLGLVNAITMSIIERTREIGVLRCIGARARDVRRIFRTETVSLAIIGFALGVPLGWVVAHALQWLVLHVAGAQLPAPYTLTNVGFALAGTVVLALLAVVVPLRRATHLRPGDAIRYQ